MKSRINIVNEKDSDMDSELFSEPTCRGCGNAFATTKTLPNTSTSNHTPKLLGCLHVICSNCLATSISVSEATPQEITVSIDCPRCNDSTILRLKPKNKSKPINVKSIINKLKTIEIETWNDLGTIDDDYFAHMRYSDDLRQKLQLIRERHEINHSHLTYVESTVDGRQQAVKRWHEKSIQTIQHLNDEMIKDLSLLTDFIEPFQDDLSKYETLRCKIEETVLAIKDLYSLMPKKMNENALAHQISTCLRDIDESIQSTIESSIDLENELNSLQLPWLKVSDSSNLISFLYANNPWKSCLNISGIDNDADTSKSAGRSNEVKPTDSRNDVDNEPLQVNRNDFKNIDESADKAQSQLPKIKNFDILKFSFEILSFAIYLVTANQSLATVFVVSKDVSQSFDVSLHGLCLAILIGIVSYDDATGFFTASIPIHYIDVGFTSLIDLCTRTNVYESSPSTTEENSNHDDFQQQNTLPIETTVDSAQYQSLLSADASTEDNHEVNDDLEVQAENVKWIISPISPKLRNSSAMSSLLSPLSAELSKMNKNFFQQPFVYDLHRLSDSYTNSSVDRDSNQNTYISSEHSVIDDGEPIQRPLKRNDLTFSTEDNSGDDGSLRISSGTPDSIGYTLDSPFNSHRVESADMIHQSAIESNEAPVVERIDFVEQHEFQEVFQSRGYMCDSFPTQITVDNTTASAFGTQIHEHGLKKDEQRSMTIAKAGNIDNTSNNKELELDVFSSITVEDIVGGVMNLMKEHGHLFTSIDDPSKTIATIDDNNLENMEVAETVNDETIGQEGSDILKQENELSIILPVETNTIESELNFTGLQPILSEAIDSLPFKATFESCSTELDGNKSIAPVQNLGLAMQKADDDSKAIICPIGLNPSVDRDDRIVDILGSNNQDNDDDDDSIYSDNQDTRHRSEDEDDMLKDDIELDTSGYDRSYDEESGMEVQLVELYEKDGNIDEKFYERSEILSKWTSPPHERSQCNQDTSNHLLSTNESVNIVQTEQGFTTPMKSVPSTKKVITRSSPISQVKGMTMHKANETSIKYTRSGLSKAYQESLKTPSKDLSAVTTPATDLTTVKTLKSIESKKPIPKPKNIKPQRPTTESKQQMKPLLEELTFPQLIAMRLQAVYDSLFYDEDRVYPKYSIATMKYILRKEETKMIHYDTTTLMKQIDMDPSLINTIESAHQDAAIHHHELLSQPISISTPQGDNESQSNNSIFDESDKRFIQQYQNYLDEMFYGELSNSEHSAGGAIRGYDHHHLYRQWPFHLGQLNRMNRNYRSEDARSVSSLDTLGSDYSQSITHVGSTVMTRRRRGSTMSSTSSESHSYHEGLKDFVGNKRVASARANKRSMT